MEGEWSEVCFTGKAGDVVNMQAGVTDRSDSDQCLFSDL